LVNFSSSRTNSQNIKEKQVCYKMLKNVLLQENKGIYCGLLNAPQNLKLLPNDKKSAIRYARNIGIHK